MATYWVEAGHGGTDSGTEANPWLTIDQAMAAVGAGDKVWVKASATYAESPDIVTAGGTTTEIVFEGYTSSTGDGGQVTIQGILTDTLSTRVMYCFKNFIFDANGANANCTQLASYEITWRNCIFKNATADGCVQESMGCFYECEFYDNALDGAAVGGGGTFINCMFYRNGASGIDCSGSVLCFNCVFFSNVAHAIDGGAANEVTLAVINCTIDGDGKDTNNGVINNASFRGFTVVINTIVYDCTTGIESSFGDRDILVFNLLNANTADYAGDASGQEGEVTDAPSFTNEVGGTDYTLTGASPARGAGTDYSADEMDMGAIQTAGGGAGAGGASKRGGKQV